MPWAHFIIKSVTSYKTTIYHKKKKNNDFTVFRLLEHYISLIILDALDQAKGTQPNLL